MKNKMPGLELGLENLDEKEHGSPLHSADEWKSLFAKSSDTELYIFRYTQTGHTYAHLTNPKSKTSSCVCLLIC